jgi:hypothetical protein
MGERVLSVQVSGPAHFIRSAPPPVPRNVLGEAAERRAGRRSRGHPDAANRSGLRGTGPRRGRGSEYSQGHKWYPLEKEDTP